MVGWWSFPFFWDGKCSGTMLILQGVANAWWGESANHPEARSMVHECFEHIFLIYLWKKKLEWIITSAGKRQLIICATLLYFWLGWHRPFEALGLSIWNQHWLLRFAWMCSNKNVQPNWRMICHAVGPMPQTMKRRRHDQICTSKDRFGTSTGEQGWNVEDH